MENNYATNGTVRVSVDVTNSSGVDGKEVVQLYIHDVHASVTRPVKELKGFDLSMIEAGQTKTIEFELTDSELGFYDNEGNWIVEPGIFRVFVGTSSDNTMDSRFEI